jgi:putative transposase
LVLQGLIEVEATQTIDAARHERTDTRVTDRNGSRRRLLTTQAGAIELRIPKLRKGRFFPSILEPCRSIDQALYAVVMEASVNGVSIRRPGSLPPRRAPPAQGREGPPGRPGAGEQRAPPGQ